MSNISKVKSNKLIKLVFLVFFVVVFQSGCAQSEYARQGGNEVGLSFVGTLFGALDWILPRAANNVPVTSGEVAYGLTASDNSGNVVGVLAGFKTGPGQFTEQEVNQSANMFVPLISDLLRENLETSVTTYPPELLRLRWGLGEAQQVHNVVESALLNILDAYFRVFVEKVQGQGSGVNIKASIYGWVPGTLQPGQFLISIEMSEDAFNTIFQMNRA